MKFYLIEAVIITNKERNMLDTSGPTGVNPLLMAERSKSVSLLDRTPVIFRRVEKNTSAVGFRNKAKLARKNDPLRPSRNEKKSVFFNV